MQLTLDADKLVLRCGYDARERAKQIAGYRWHKASKTWRYDWPALGAIRVEFGDELEEDPAITLRVEAEVEAILLASSIKAGALSAAPLFGAPAYFYEHQRRALTLALAFPSAAIFAETGTGKTPVAIEIIRALGGPALVVCPLSIIEAAWIADLARFAPELKPQNLWARSRKKRLEALAQPADVYIINHEGARVLEKELTAKQWSVLIVDESSCMKSPGAAITRALLRLGKNIPRRYVMSGTPAPNSPLEYFAQMKLVDPSLLGDSFYAFRSRHFYPDGYMGYDWRITKKKERELMERIAARAFYCSKAECLDLPPQVYTVRHVEMTDNQVRVYKEMKDDLVASIGDTQVLAASQVTKIMKLRQVTSGFLRGPVMDYGVSLAKFEELTRTLEEIGNHQVIIWGNFIWEMRHLRTMLRDKAVALYGEIPHDEREEAIKRFKSGDVQYLIANPHCAGHGLTFTNCKYAVYYSLDWSYEAFKQSQDRIHRIGQEEKVQYIFLLCKDSIDQALYKALSKKRDVGQALLDMLRGSGNEEAEGKGLRVRAGRRQKVGQGAGGVLDG